MTAGCVVLAMRKEAFETAFCIATDATGVAVQPEPSKTGERQACRKGHFFVLLADRDHVLFEYMPRETSVTRRRDVSRLCRLHPGRRQERL